LLDTGNGTLAALVTELHAAMAGSNDFKLNFAGASASEQAAIKAVLDSIAKIANLKFGATGVDIKPI
jgi:hypothetical protein